MLLPQIKFASLLSTHTDNVFLMVIFASFRDDQWKKGLTQQKAEEKEIIENYYDRRKMRKSVASTCSYR